MGPVCRAICIVAFALMMAPRAAHAGDPLRIYREVETEHFIIYYWQSPGEPMDDVAHRVGVVAERAHRNLSPALDHLPTEKTIIFLTDDTDSANGFAGVLPRNAIQLYATGPTSFSELDDHDDWLYGLIAHEYTHILHLDIITGVPVIVNHVVGKIWAPSQIMPRWLIEGLAVYEESKRSAGGRDRGTRFEQFIRIARHAGVDLRLDEISGAPRQFPRGNAIYVYGSHFLRYVFDRFGDDTARAMAHLAGGYAVPFAVNRQIAKVVGKPFTELYDDWKNYLRDRYGMEEMAAERRGIREGRALTHTAETNTFLRYTPDGRELYWLQADGYSLATVRAMPAGGEQRDAHDVVTIDSLGPFDIEPDGSLIYEQSRTFRIEYSFQDVFRWDARTHATTRITHGLRARDPALSPDGRRVAFSKNEHSTSVLAVADVAPDAEVSVLWRGDRYDEAYQPSWSPDGTRIAFSAWQTGGFRDIVVLELASGKVEAITHDRAIDQMPSWSADGRYLVFTSDRTGIANIYAFDTTTRATWQITNVLGGAFDARVSPDGTHLAFESAVAAGGYDIYELRFDPAAWQPARDYVDDKPPPTIVRDDEAVVSAPRPYRALETLAPQTYQLQLDLANKTSDVSTSGVDASGLHSYSLSVGLNLDTGNTDVGLAYSYGGLRPNLRVAGSRTLVRRGNFRVDGINRGFDEEDWSGTLSLGVPFESRPESSWSLSFDYDVDWFRFIRGPAQLTADPDDPNNREPVIPVTDYVESGVSARLGFSNVRGTTFGVGNYSGFDASAALRIDHPALGSTYRAMTFSYTFDTFQNLYKATTTLALRISGAIRQGDLIKTAGFSLGGISSQDIVQSIVDSTRTGTTGYLRGYPARTVTGNQVALANLELRHELWQIEHGLETIPIYIRRLHVVALFDAGTAYVSTFDYAADARAAVGGALRLDAFFGYFVPGTFEVGYSHGLIGKGALGETWFLLTGTL